MDDNINKDMDNLSVDEEEIKKVEEMLMSSKAKRKKMLEERNPNKQNNSKMTFIDVCKNNIVVPICLFLAVAAIVFGIVYFINNSKTTKINSLGFTYSQLTENYHNTALYKDLFSQFNTELPEISYTTDVENPDKNLNYFGASVPHEFTSYSIAIQGSARKSDGELKGFRIMYEVPSDESAIDENASSLFLFYNMVMNSVYPELTTDEIVTMLAKASETKQFEIYGNIAYRFSIQKVDGISFYALDFAPAADYQSVE